MSASVAVGLGEAVHDAAGNERCAPQRFDRPGHPALFQGLVQPLAGPIETAGGLGLRIDLERFGFVHARILACPLTFSTFFPNPLRNLLKLSTMADIVIADMGHVAPPGRRGTVGQQ